MRRRTDDGRRSIAAIAGLALALLATVAGCGDPLADKLESSGRQPFSDDDPALADGTTTTTAPTDLAAMARWTFVTEVNEVCVSRGLAVGAGLVNGGDLDDAGAMLQQLVGLYETLAAVIGGMTPPPGDEAVVAEIVGSYTHIADMIRAGVSRTYRTQAELDAFVAELQAAEATVIDRLNAYGLSSCVGSSS